MGWIAQLLRLPYVKSLWTRFPVGPLSLRVQYGIFRTYPHYGYGVYQSALRASRLKVPRITAIEFGVAGAGRTGNCGACRFSAKFEVAQYS